MELKKKGTTVIYLIGAALLVVACINYVNYFRTIPGDPVFPENADPSIQALKDVLIQNEIANILKDPSNAEIHFTNDLFRDVGLEMARENLNRGLLFSGGGLFFFALGFFLTRKFRNHSNSS